ncbi:methyltransferase domain-containing protein [Chroococcidiopsis sp. FACHB-1243]|uniref:class I SAM-dependent methyltransferase n=1 Tax=Chroococcidiopsis sp. [FACHB-1243] TaxID=2692781 RepID=UPI00177B1A0C|nr:class I SAM-dependent methyltransferase [Chroococcidiopsis sp. [FACHB-1243]]MBD2308551.1 methyltransferase domain-containing protein [Chroococcidiopsis sp. [FACHB-1243]]
MPENAWNTSLYESKHAFVWQYGESLLELLSPQSGERILDLGCGTGQLTEKIAIAGADVIGIDSDRTMIEKAKQNYPQLQFDVIDAREFQFSQSFDAVFSNAVLHWIVESEAVIYCIHKVLKPGGRFVAEFGGKGNIKAIATSLTHAFNQLGYSVPQTASSWYFPSISEYSSQLEKVGMEVTYAVLFDRLTPLEGGDLGMRNWIQMFASRFLAELSTEHQRRVLELVEQQLKPMLYRDEKWWADYRRIRVVAVKI